MAIEPLTVDEAAQVSSRISSTMILQNLELAHPTRIRKTKNVLWVLTQELITALGNEAPDMNINIIIFASIRMIDHFDVKSAVKGSFRESSVQQASLMIARWDNFIEFENLSPEDF